MLWRKIAIFHSGVPTSPQKLLHLQVSLNNIRRLVEYHIRQVARRPVEYFFLYRMKQHLRHETNTGIHWSHTGSAVQPRFPYWQNMRVRRSIPRSWLSSHQGVNKVASGWSRIQCLFWQLAGTVSIDKVVLMSEFVVTNREDSLYNWCSVQRRSNR